MKRVLGRALHLRGEVRSERPLVIAKATLRTRGLRAETRLVAHPFELLLEDGSIVGVDCEALRSEDVLIDEVTERGKWQELERRPIAAAFAGHAPGPHVHAVLTGGAVEPGARVVVLGVISALSAESETAAYRGSHELAIAAIRASHLAAGPDADDRIEYARATVSDKQRVARGDAGLRAAKSSIGRVLGVAIGIGATLALVTMIARAPWLLAHWVAAIAYLGIATWRMDRKIPFSASQTHPLEVTSVVLALLVPCAMSVDHLRVLFSGHGAIGRSTIAFVPLGFAIAAWLNLLGYLLATGDAVRIARQILKTTIQRDALEAGRWGAITGRVADPTPVTVTGAQAAVSRVKRRARTDVVLDDTFVLESALGKIVVDPKDAVWSSAVRREVGTARGGGYVLEEIPVGASALVVGRTSLAEGGHRIVATGPESLFVFAVGANQDPRVELEAFLAKRRRALRIELAGSVALSAVAAVTLYFA